MKPDHQSARTSRYAGSPGGAISPELNRLPARTCMAWLAGSPVRAIRSKCRPSVYPNRMARCVGGPGCASAPNQTVHPPEPIRHGVRAVALPPSTEPHRPSARARTTQCTGCPGRAIHPKLDRPSARTRMAWCANSIGPAILPEQNCPSWHDEWAVQAEPSAPNRTVRSS